ncbi:hypothetical protein JCM8547_005664 [Rhodosporidiobolus lusitaniae]
MPTRRPAPHWPRQADPIMRQAAIDIPMFPDMSTFAEEYPSTAHPGRLVVWDQAVAERCNDLKRTWNPPLEFEFTRANVRRRRNQPDWKSTIAWPAEADPILLRAQLEITQHIGMSLKAPAYPSPNNPARKVVWDEAVAELCNTFNHQREHPLEFEFTKNASYLWNQKLYGYSDVPQESLPSTRLARQEGRILYQPGQHGQSTPNQPAPQDQQEGEPSTEHSISHRYLRRAQRAGLSERSTARYFGSGL